MKDFVDTGRMLGRTGAALSARHWSPSSIQSALIYLVLGLLVFHQVFSTWFLSDDLVIFNLISINPFGYVDGGFFRPLCDFTNYLTFLVFGYEAWPYKITNLLLHIANSWMVMVIGGSIFMQSAALREKSFYRWLPFVAGLLFLIWPIRSESVFWGAGRASTLAFFFFALSLIGYFYQRQNGKVIALAGALLMFFTSLFCYESVFTIPLVIFAVTLWLRYSEGPSKRREPMSDWYPVLGFFAVLLLYLGIRYGITGQVLGGYGSGLHAKVNSNILRNIFVYPFKMMLGAGGYSKSVFVILAAAVTVCFGILKLRYFQKNRGKVPALWFFLIITMYLASLPVLNLSMSISDTQFDRYLYLPSLFMVIMLVAFISTFIHKKSRFILVFGLTCIYAVSTSYIQSGHWKSASLEVKKTIETINSLEKKEGNLIILNVPDHYCGAYLLRNGIHEGIKFLCPETKFKSVHLLGLHPVYSINEVVDVSVSGNNVLLTLQNPDAEIYFEEKSSAFFEVMPASPNQFNVEFKTLGPDDVVIYWSAGAVSIAELPTIPIRQ